MTHRHSLRPRWICLGVASLSLLLGLAGCSWNAAASTTCIGGSTVRSGSNRTTIWTSAAPLTVSSSPNGKNAVTTLLSTNFSATVAGSGRMVGSTMWCPISWQVVGTTESGWLPITDITHTPPPTPVKPIVSLDALSPSLAAYAGSLGSGITVAVYSPDDQRYYVDNGDVTTVMGSTAKVPILLTLLRLAEGQDRTLTDDELDMATEMIEESNNDDAQSLYEEVTQDGVTDYLNSIGVTGITMNDDFGWSTTTPLAMAQLLDGLRTGSIVNATDQAFALNLMSNIDPEQQFGVGETAPSGATYAMKDGWVVAPDGTWTNGSVGIVTTPKHTYIIAVYAQGNANLSWTTVDDICSATASRFS